MLIDETEESLWYPLCNMGWSGDKDGYYLSGAFDTSNGPAEYWYPYGQSKSNKEIYSKEGTPKNYQYEVNAVVGIRK